MPSLARQLPVPVAGLRGSFQLGAGGSCSHTAGQLCCQGFCTIRQPPKF